MSIFERETSLLNSGLFELKRRRAKWKYFVKSRVIDKLNLLASDLEASGYPYQMRCALGSSDKNLQTIQLSLSKNCTGVLQEEITKQYTRQSRVIESNCALVFSQSITGSIAVIFYPYKSEYHERQEDCILLYSDLLPESLTDEFIERCFERFLLYVRFSSLYGSTCPVTFIDRVRFRLLLSQDIREIYKLFTRWKNLESKWLEIIVTILLSSIVATLVTTLLQ